MAGRPESSRSDACHFPMNPDIGLRPSGVSRIPADLQQAIEAHKAGDLDTAAPLYRQYLARDPSNPTALQLLGLLHSQRGEYETAITYMQESLRRFPQQAEVANNLGIALAQLGRTNEALERYRQAVTLEPRYSLAWRNIGLCQLQRQNFEPAQAALKRCLVINAGDAAAWLGLANTWKRQDKPEKAIAYLQRAIEVRPDYAAAYHNLGVCLRLTGQSGQAIEHYQTALRLGLKRPELYQNLGNALVDMGEFEPAIAAYREAIARAPDSPELKQLLTAAEEKKQRRVEKSLEQECLDPDIDNSWSGLPDPEFAQLLRHARGLHAAGRLEEAEQLYRRLEHTGAERETVLRSLMESYLAARRPEAAVEVLTALTREVPDTLYYFGRLAVLLEGLGRAEEAITHYQRLLERRPDYAAAWFNLALLCKKQRRYAEARAAYENAVRHGIDNVQEVYSNLGVLFSERRQAEQAEAMYRRALEMDADYIPAIFNLAGLHEESGKRQEALELYQRILALDPAHWESLARLVHAQNITPENHQLMETLKSSIVLAGRDDTAQETLHFALGKALDDLGRYDEAFTAYRTANGISRTRRAPYRRDVTEQAFGRLIELFSADWIEQNKTDSPAAPIFICGMFRSGSTLIEQILARHPAITPGGELDILPWLVAQRLSPFPDAVMNSSRQKLAALSDGYLAALRDLFPDALSVTDKRPDNFLFLGLIKCLFPRARIIYTRRQPLDNCLSIYFQQLGGNLNYATDLADTAHYYRQHDGLITHWQRCFSRDIFTVDYDELVAGPEPVLQGLLEFLNLPWDTDCLRFRDADNLVKTASVWQVREGLHRHSSGRWRHYAVAVENLKTILE